MNMNKLLVVLFEILCLSTLAHGSSNISIDDKISASVEIHDLSNIIHRDTSPEVIPSSIQSSRLLRGQPIQNSIHSANRLLEEEDIAVSRQDFHESSAGQLVLASAGALIFLSCFYFFLYACASSRCNGSKDDSKDLEDRSKSDQTEDASPTEKSIVSLSPSEEKQERLDKRRSRHVRWVDTEDPKLTPSSLPTSS
jgi:hypothetical protein